MCRVEVLHEDEGHAGVRGKAPTNFLDASSPPAEAPIATIGNITRSSRGPIADDGARREIGFFIAHLRMGLPSRQSLIRYAIIILYYDRVISQRSDI